MSQSFTFAGTVTDAQTVHLAEPLPVTSGEVRVTVEIVDAEKPKWQTFFEQVWAAREASGRPPMPVEEIDAWVAEIKEARG